ncbi:ABC transporter ATP-binding protein [Benzoatithermus flavus]|uniref:ABC transporter ATP-binding protein n=1 Tax=Benzoatithermus flavus TaxID=3108223 RepID=A0ABU8XRL3_9PROT
MLVIDRIAKRFANGYEALSQVSLSLRAGEILAVVGASGCGKSTLLRLVAGLETPSAGVILLDGERLSGPSPRIGVVFQEPRLMPWLKLVSNVAFGLPRRLPKAERMRLARAALARVGLARFEDALPKTLSGGMAQRAAIARALVTRPPVLLLDEPFSALDALTRQALQEELLRLWAEDRPTMVLVTHDLDEALYLADRVVVLGGHPGRVRLELEVSLPRPRPRDGTALAALRERLFAELPHGPVELAA